VQGLIPKSRVRTEGKDKHPDLERLVHYSGWLFLQRQGDAAHISCLLF